MSRNMELEDFSEIEARRQHFDELCLSAAEEAGNQMYVDELASVLTAQHVSVWNIGVNLLQTKGRRVLVRDSLPGYDFTSSTGLLEFSGMTPDLEIDAKKGVDVARVSCMTFSDELTRERLPKPAAPLAVTAGKLDGKMPGQCIKVDCMTVFPIGTWAVASSLVETYESDQPRRWYRHRATTEEFAQQPTSLAAQRAKIEDPIWVYRPAQPDVIAGLTTLDEVDASVAAARQKMAPIMGLYKVIGALGRPLHERPEFGVSYAAPESYDWPMPF